MDYPTYSGISPVMHRRDEPIIAVFEILDRLLPDPQVRDAAKLALLKPENSAELDAIVARLSAPSTETISCDPWISRARPAFLYIIYALLLWAIPMGLMAAIRPDMTEAVSRGMNLYLNGLPESLYALFGTGYLGYTAARTWGKVKGVDK